MDTNRERVLYRDLSYKVVGLAMEVHRKLGYGFLEKVYENAMIVLFQREGIPARQQVPVRVYFEGAEVGYYLADIVVEDKLIIELKAAENLVDGHRAQTLNYLKATNMQLAILLNFGKQKLQY
ncbi:MAG TPA: GxxExxY protein, partial [Blastocatellia bacterium]